MKPRPISLPADMMPHDAIIEWWYWNGMLADKKGNRYSYMDCLFRADMKRVNIPYLKSIFGRGAAERRVLFAHSMFADLDAKKTEKNVQNISFASRDSFSRPLFYVQYLDPIAAARGFVVYEMKETKAGAFHVKTDRVDLTLFSRKHPLLEGGSGFIDVRGRKSFYYSLTDLETIGAVRVGEEWVPVTGRSWMDHQWADVAYANDAWTWFSFQLDDGTDLMCVEYDDGKGKDHVVDLIDRRGRQKHAAHAVFAPGRSKWKSKITKAAYPLTWTITIPELDIALETAAILPDQEMIFGAINYWEGPVTVAGTIGARRVSGTGFMELAGYPSHYNYLQSQIAAKIKGLIKAV